MTDLRRPIHKFLCANRGEIAIRVFRACAELGIRTVAVYSHEDRHHLHRYKADESYLVGRGKTPVAAYLDIDEIVAVALKARRRRDPPRLRLPVGERRFARAVRRCGIAFVGPSPESSTRSATRPLAAQRAAARGRADMPGTELPRSTKLATIRAFVASTGFP
jgi:pyruvate carboxylase